MRTNVSIARARLELGRVLVRVVRGAGRGSIHVNLAGQRANTLRRRATPGGWWRPRRISSITSAPVPAGRRRSLHWREWPLTGHFRGDPEWQELAGQSRSILTSLCPLRKGQQLLGACSSTPGPDRGCVKTHPDFDFGSLLTPPCPQESNTARSERSNIRTRYPKLVFTQPRPEATQIGRHLPGRFERMKSVEMVSENARRIV